MKLWELNEEIELVFAEGIDVHTGEISDDIMDKLDALEKYVPGIRGKLDHVEAATPRTFHRYTGHLNGATFGTKFEGLKVSMELPKQIAGLFHTGSVGIIMSGWLGAINYGVIVANEVESFLHSGTHESQGILT